MESTNQTLAHYGVKGMKWGVRRKQRNVIGTPGGVKGGPYGENKPLKGAKSGPYHENQKTPGVTRSASAKKRSRLERAADAAQRDADNLRKHGYTAEADAVQKVADKNRQKAERQKQTVKRGAKAIVTALQVVGPLYYTDLALTGGATTRAAVKVGKATVKSVLNKVGDQMFDYAVLDKDGKVLRRYN